MGTEAESLKNGNDQPKNGTTDALAVSAEKKNLDEITDVDTVEGQAKKLKYPKSVFFIISNEFCERFNYYGMRTILVLYLSRALDYDDNTATVIFHIFTMFVYFLCTFGAIIADSWLGKFRTILYLSMVYVTGSVLITLGAIPPLKLPGVTFTMLGLALIALGSGGIKPCVAAFGGDQFKLPEQVKQVATYFSLFYFAINSGSLISTTITPILREDVHCFGENDCYSLAFGVPAVLMAVSIVIFLLGKPLYKSQPPAGNMLVTVSKTIGNAISTRHREKKTNPREHWLDYADGTYDKQSIEDIKVLLRVLVLYIPLPIFWALFDQQGSRWTFQATRMDGDLGSFDIKPDQLQMLNPLLILVFIPAYRLVFYPLLAKIGIRRPLQKLCAGGVLAGIAFIISALVELQLEKTYPVLPGKGLSQLRMFNGISGCDYTVKTNIPDHTDFLLKSLDSFEYKDITDGDHFDISLEYIPTKTGCPLGVSETIKVGLNNATTVFLRSVDNQVNFHMYGDSVDKPSRGNPVIRTLSNLDKPAQIKWVEDKRKTVRYNENSEKTDLNELTTTKYNVLVDDTQVGSASFKQGGSYVYIISQTANGYATATHVIAEPNSMNILWLVPQYVVMTLGEVMFSVTGLEFSYDQAPNSMKSVLQACWLLTVAFGNVVVVIIAELELFESQANEFFLFAGLMFADMIIFAIMAYYYKPNNSVPSEDSDTTELIKKDDDDSKPQALEFTPAVTKEEIDAKPSTDDLVDNLETKIAPKEEKAQALAAALEAKIEPLAAAPLSEAVQPKAELAFDNGIDRPSPPTVESETKPVPAAEAAAVDGTVPTTSEPATTELNTTKDVDAEKKL